MYKYRYYNEEALLTLKINGVNPPGCSLPEPAKALKKFDKVNDNDYFAVSTLFKTPKVSYKKGEVVKLEGFPLRREAVCIGHLLHTEKGYRMKSYIFQFC